MAPDPLFQKSLIRACLSAIFDEFELIVLVHFVRTNAFFHPESDLRLTWIMFFIPVESGLSGVYGICIYILH